MKKITHCSLWILIALMLSPLAHSAGSSSEAAKESLISLPFALGISVAGTALLITGLITLYRFIGKSVINLKTTVLVALSALFLSFLGIAVYTISSLKQIGEEVTMLAEELIPLGNMASMVTEHQLEQEVQIERFFRLKEDKFSKEFMKLGEKVKDEILKAEKIVENGVKMSHNAEEKKYYQDIYNKLKEIDTTHDQYEKDSEHAVELIHENAAPEKINEEIQHSEEAAHRLEQSLSSLLENIEHKVEEAGRAAEIHEKNTATIVIALMVFILSALIATIAFIWLLSRTIVGRVVEQCDILNDSSRMVEGASGEVSESSQAIAEASSEQAASIEETSASLEEFSRMTENNANDSAESKKLAEEVKNISAQGSESMRKLLNSMKEIKESNESIRELVKVIEKIGEKTAIIDEIVFQTKLLSFNASVEAERAGEHGRGFAVVAQEVGNLAQMSGKAALEISEIVKDSVSKAQSISNENKAKVEEGDKLSTETNEYLNAISASAEKSVNLASKINVASNEQSSGIRQINEAIVELDKATQANSSTSEETASASEELNAQARTLTHAVNTLLETVGVGSHGTPSEFVDLSSDGSTNSPFYRLQKINNGMKVA